VRFGLRASNPKSLEDPEVQKLLAELDATLTLNPLQGYNHPDLPKRHVKQLAFHAARTKIKALIAGNRSGKTVACIVDDLIQAVPENVLPEHLRPFKKWHPPFHCWIGAPKFSKHEDTIIPLIRRFIPRDQLIEGSFEKSYRRQPVPILRLVCGSTIGFKTYDQDIDAWASAEVHRIHWDEEPDGDHGRILRSEARARLVSTNGDEIIGMTPLLGYSWVYDEIWERRNEPQITVVQMDIEDNPWNTKEAIEDFLSELTEEEKRARKSGQFVHFGGLFFDEFRDPIHVVDPPPLERVKAQDVVVGIDPGLRRTGITWTAFDNDNAGVTFDEYYPKECVVPTIAAEIKRRNKAYGIDPVFVIDPSARNRSAINADQIEAAFAREDIYCQHGQNDRAAGILEVKRRFQATDANGNPAPTLVISRNCKHLIWEIGRYRRDPNASDEFAAIKADDHLVDSLRYAVMSRAWEVGEPPAGLPPHAYLPDFEPPYSGHEFLTDPPPMGAMS
jgi:phage terminase large subunit-like protein